MRRFAERFQITVPDSYSERYNLAPTQKALIVHEREGEREAVLARWGLLPHWGKDERFSYKLINARAETLTEKPVYRSLLTKGRCLVVADAFYEMDRGAGWEEASDLLSPRGPGVWGSTEASTDVPCARTRLRAREGDGRRGEEFALAGFALGGRPKHARPLARTLAARDCSSPLC